MRIRGRSSLSGTNPHIGLSDFAEPHLLTARALAGDGSFTAPDSLDARIPSGFLRARTGGKGGLHRVEKAGRRSTLVAPTPSSPFAQPQALSTTNSPGPARPTPALRRADVPDARGALDTLFFGTDWPAVAGLGGLDACSAARARGAALPPGPVAAPAEANATETTSTVVLGFRPAFIEGAPAALATAPDALRPEAAAAAPAFAIPPPSAHPAWHQASRPWRSLLQQPALAAA